MEPVPVDVGFSESRDGLSFHGLCPRIPKLPPNPVMETNRDYENLPVVFDFPFLRVPILGPSLIKPTA